MGKRDREGGRERKWLPLQREREERREGMRSSCLFGKGGVGGWWSLSLKRIRYPGSKEDQENYNRETLCLEQRYLLVFS